MTHLYCRTHVCDSCVALCVAFICGMTHPCPPWLISVRLDSFVLSQMCVDGLYIAIPEALMWHVSFRSADKTHLYSLTWLIHQLQHDLCILPLTCVDGSWIAIFIHVQHEIESRYTWVRAIQESHACAWQNRCVMSHKNESWSRMSHGHVAHEWGQYKNQTREWR